MGLDTFATGLSHEDNFHGSYGRYSAFIEELINHVYGTKCREIFRRGRCDGFCDGKYIGPLTEEDMSMPNRMKSAAQCLFPSDMMKPIKKSRFVYSRNSKNSLSRSVAAATAADFSIPPAASRCLPASWPPVRL